MNKTFGKSQSKVPFYLIIFYLCLEYVRPQNIFPGLQILHLPAITVILIAIFLLVLGRFYIKDKQTCLFLLLLGEMVIHGPLALNNYWAFQMFYEMTITFIAYMGIINFIDTDIKYNKMLKYWIIIFVFIAIYGYFNADLYIPKSKRHGFGVGGFIGDANDFCLALNMIIPFTLFGLISEKNKTNKIYFGVLTCLFLFIIFITESRGGFIGLVSVAIYCWLRSKKKVLLAVIMGLLVLFALAVAPATYWDEIRSIAAEDTENQMGTGAQRIYAWKLGWEMFLENPVIGVGQGNYPWHVGNVEEKLDVLWRTRSLAGRAAHSLYFTLLPELGLVGIFIFIFLIYYTLSDLKYIRKVSKNRKDIFDKEETNRLFYLTLSLEGSLVAYLSSGIFVSVLYYPNVWILFAFVLALKRIVNKKESDEMPIVKTKSFVVSSMHLDTNG